MDMQSSSAVSSMGAMTMATSTGAMSSMMPAATATATMGSSMDMGMGGAGACKISMLWNWNTIDTCFISSTWHITSKGMFAGSCIGVICLVCVLELLRRLGREYDRYIFTQASASRPSPNNSKTLTSSSSDTETGAQGSTASRNGLLLGFFPQQHAQARPTLLQQTVRALLHMLQFGVAYFIMLLAMYYNGYFIICILIGAFIGAFVFSWDLSTGGFEGSSGCCGE